MKRTEKITFTASRFAALVGCDRHDITRKLAEINAIPVSTTGRGAEYSLKDLHRAATGGDQAAERLRKLRAECSKLEHDLAVKRREFISVSAITKLGQGVAVAIKNIVLGSPLPPEAQDKILWELVALGEQDWSHCGE